MSHPTTRATGTATCLDRPEGRDSPFWSRSSGTSCDLQGHPREARLSAVRHSRRPADRAARRAGPRHLRHDHLAIAAGTWVRPTARFLGSRGSGDGRSRPCSWSGTEGTADGLEASPGVSRRRATANRDATHRHL